MSVRSVFVQILGSSIGIIAGAILGGYLKIQGIAIILPITIGLFLGRFLFTRLFGKTAANRIYKETEKAVHGHPFKTLLLWLLMFAILAGALIIFGSGF